LSFVGLLCFFFFAQQAQAVTLFLDDFQDENDTILSVHDSHWVTPSFASPPKWGEYVIFNNTAGDGAGSVYDVNQLDNIDLPSHFIVTQNFNISSDISFDGNEAFMDVRLNDATDNNSALFRFYPSLPSVKLESLGSVPYQYSTTGVFNFTENNTISVEYDSGNYVASINGIVTLTFSDASFIPRHIIINQHINTSDLTRFEVSDFTTTPSPTVTPALTGTPIPSPTSSVKKVVLVPGMEASWNADAILNCKLDPEDYEGEWTLAPFAEFAYSPLLDRLGVTENVEVHPYYYDWRIPVTLNGVGLGSHIGSVAASGRVDVVGHSMGGLVSRRYLELVENANRVDKMITVGSPHMGAVNAYPAWSAGEIWDSDLIQRIALSLLLKSCGQFFHEDDRATVENYFPSVQDILPVFNYLRDKKTGDYIDVGGMTASNLWLMNSIFGTPFFNVNMGTLSGTGEPTLAELDVIGANPRDVRVGDWADGRPTRRYESTAGDGAVLNISSMLPDATQNSIINQDHIGIINSTEGIDAILSFLDIDSFSSVVSPLFRPNSALVVATYPGEFEVVDVDGEVIKSENGIAVLFSPVSGRRVVRRESKEEGVMMIGRFLPDGRFDWQEIGSGRLGNDDYSFDY